MIYIQTSVYDGEIPLPSLPYLKMLSQGGIDPIKALKLMLEKEKVSSDIVVLIDEMFLQKGAQYHGGSLVGMDENGDMYTGVVTFMAVGLNKEAIPFVVKACPEIKICGDWLREEIEETLGTMGKAGFRVRAVITDNHSVNVNAFKSLRIKYGNVDDELSFNFSGQKIYNLYDSVHLIKNIRNNLLSAKRFIFPSFKFYGFYDPISVEAGEISWRLLHDTYEKDLILPSNLRKAPKLNPKTLHPENNKQNVPLALNIF